MQICTNVRIAKLVDVSLMDILKNLVRIERQANNCHLEKPCQQHGKIRF